MKSPFAYERRDRRATKLALRRIFLLAIAEHAPRMIEDMYSRCLVPFRALLEKLPSSLDPWSEGDAGESQRFHAALADWQRVNALIEATEERWIADHAKLALRLFPKDRSGEIEAWRAGADRALIQARFNLAPPETDLAVALRWIETEEHPEPPRLPEGLPPLVRANGSILTKEGYLKLVRDSARAQLEGLNLTKIALRKAVSGEEETAAKYFTDYRLYLLREGYLAAIGKKDPGKAAEMLARYLAGAKTRQLVEEASSSQPDSLWPQAVENAINRFASVIGLKMPERRGRPKKSKKNRLVVGFFQVESE